MKIGYLIPEFPGQTHSFFWRERNALLKMGVHPVFISTRLPHSKAISQRWAKDIISSTIYLNRPSFKVFLNTMGLLLTAGWKKRKEIYHLFTQFQSNSIKDRFNYLIALFFGAELSVLAQQFDWKHIHVHSCGNSANIALFANCLSGLPYSLTLHNPVWVHGSNQSLKWSQARFGIVVSPAIFHDLKKQLGNHLPQVIKIAPMGVECDVFKREIPLKFPQTITIFSCGRINCGKGYDLLLEALSNLKKRNYSINLRIAGTTDSKDLTYLNALQEYAKKNDLDKNIVWLGAISEEEVKEELEKAHIFVLASRSGEALGVATMEAMSMELPVIVTDVGGVSELVENRKEGLLIPPNNSKAIEDAIVELINSPEIAIKMGKLGRSKIKEKYNSTLSAAAISDCLKEIK